MANLLKVQRTLFLGVNKDGTETGRKFGYLIFDDYGQIYNDTLPVDGLAVSDADLLKNISNYDSTASPLITSMIENGKGISIDGEYHDWDWVKKVLDIED